MTINKQIHDLNPVAAFTDTSVFPIEDSANGNVTEGASGLDLQTYLTSNSFLTSTAIGISVQAYDTDLASIAALTQGASKVIISDGTSWTSAKLSLGDINNVVITSLTSGDLIRYNGANFVNTQLDIVNTNINGTANIDYSKLAALTTGKVLQSNGTTGHIEASGISNATLAFLDATSSVQTQLNGKETADITILKSADIGSTVQGYDANILVSGDIGSTIQGYNSDLTAIAALTHTANNVINSDGTNWISTNSLSLLNITAGTLASKLEISDIAGDVTFVADGTNTDVNVIINAKGAGFVKVDGYQLIAERNNATALRVRGLSHASDGGDIKQNYIGMFFDNAYNTVGVKNTRAIFGGNYDMDVEIQSAHGVIIFGCDDTKTDGKIVNVSKTDVVFNLRADSEVLSPNQLIFDRVSTSTTGAANTSDVAIKTNTGNLVLSPTGVIIADVAVQLPIHTTSTANALTTKATGQVVYVANGDNGTADCLAAYNGTDWKVIAFGATIA